MIGTNVLNFMMIDNTEQLIAAGTHQWYFQLRLAMNGNGIFIGREFLSPISGGYTARVIVGADEGSAQTYDVRFFWHGGAADADAALRSLQISVARPSRGSS